MRRRWASPCPRRPPRSSRRRSSSATLASTSSPPRRSWTRPGVGARIRKRGRRGARSSSTRSSGPSTRRPGTSSSPALRAQLLWPAKAHRGSHQAGGGCLGRLDVAVRAAQHGRGLRGLVRDLFPEPWRAETPLSQVGCGGARGRGIGNPHRGSTRIFDRVGSVCSFAVHRIVTPWCPPQSLAPGRMGFSLNVRSSLSAYNDGGNAPYSVGASRSKRFA